MIDRRVLFQKPYMVTAYSPIVNNEALVFSLDPTNAALITQQTGSTWTLFGKCIEGTYKGLQLPAIDAGLTEWFEGVRYYPKN